jgi:hypothetical protein
MTSEAAALLEVGSATLRQWVGQGLFLAGSSSSAVVANHANDGSSESRARERESVLRTAPSANARIACARRMAP